MTETAPYRYAAAWLTFHAVMVGVARLMLFPLVLAGPAPSLGSPLILAGAFCSFLLWFGVSWATFRWTVHELVIKPPFIRLHRKPPEIDELPYTEAWTVYLGLSAALMVLVGLALTLWPAMGTARAPSAWVLLYPLTAMVVVFLTSFLAFRWSVRSRVEPLLDQDVTSG